MLPFANLSGLGSSSLCHHNILKNPKSWFNLVPTNHSQDLTNNNHCVNQGRGQLNICIACDMMAMNVNNQVVKHWAYHSWQLVFRNPADFSRWNPYKIRRISWMWAFGWSPSIGLSFERPITCLFADIYQVLILPSSSLSNLWTSFKTVNNGPLWIVSKLMQVHAEEICSSFY